MSSFVFAQLRHHSVTYEMILRRDCAARETFSFCEQLSIEELVDAADKGCVVLAGDVSNLRK